MPTLINDAKEATESFQPLHLFDFIWPDGSTESVCSHAVTYLGVPYEARVVSQQFEPIQALSPTGIDVPPSVTVVLADADQAMSAIEAARRWRGARLRVTFVYYDFGAGAFSSDAIVPFVGRCGRPEVADDTVTVQAGYILNLGAKYLPSFPVSQRCPKLKPRTADQVALKDVKGSLYFECGSGTTADCGFVPVGCAAENDPLRFGGVLYQVPPGSHSLEFETGKWLDQTSDLANGRYGDFVPIVFGTAWVDCVGLGAWPEGNSTRGEVLVCEGRPEAILKVTAADETLPPSNDLDYNALRVTDPLMRYDVVSNGERTGRLNPDSPWNGTGDPQGSVCKLEWVVYRRVTTGQARVRALVKGPRVHAYARIDSITAGVVTLAGGRPNRDIAGNAPFTVRIFGNSNAALNDTFGLTGWAYGPPGTVTLDGTADSGTGGYLEYETSSDQYAWAILALLRRCGQPEDLINYDEFIAANEAHLRLVDYTARYSNEWASGVAYASGAVVHYGSANWLSKQGENTGHEPGAVGSEDWWDVTDAAPAAQPTGVTAQHQKYKLSLVIQQRRSAEDVMAGLLRGCDSQLRRDLATGAVGLLARGSLAEQQPAAMDGSNYDTAIAGGHVAYRFAESSMVRRKDGTSTFRRVKRDGSAVANSVSIAFTNEDNDYSGDYVRVVDADDINLMGQDVGGSWQAGGCTALDRANRVGSIFLANQIDGDWYEWETSHKAVKLRTGDLIAFDSDKKGFTLQLARAQRIEPRDNWETAKIQVSLHDDAWYADSYQRGPASGAVAPPRPRAARPPRVWSPNAVAPEAGDPLYAATEKTFGISVGYALLQNGTPQPVITVRGAAPVNTPANLQPPVIGAQGYTADAGGAIAGGGSVYFAVVASLDGAGNPGPTSNVCQIVVAQAGDDNTITIQVGYFDAAGAGFAVYVGRNAARMTRQDDTLHGVGAPAAITVTAYDESTEAAPDTEAAAVVVRPRVVRHYGPWAAAANVVGAGTIEITGAGWPAGQWVDCDCTVLAKADGSDLPVLNFHVTGSTGSVLTVTPDPAAAGVVAGDLIGMMSLPTVTGFVVSDANWMNTLSGGGAGLAIDAEIGAYWRIVGGAGRGYRYPIVDNDATSITVQGPWVVAPDATSRGVIEEAGPLGEVRVAVQNGDPAAQLSAALNVANYAGAVVELEAVVRSEAGLESAGALNPVRCVWVAGAQGTRVITAATAGGMLPTDSTLEFDTSGVTQPAADSLDGAVDGAQTNWVFASGVDIVNGTVLECGTERVYVESGTGTAREVTRGWGGTTPAAHADLAAVTVPGALVWTILPIAQLPNQALLFRKLSTSPGSVPSTDLNYVKLLPTPPDLLPDAEAFHLLADDSSAYGVFGLKAPGA